MAAKLAPRNVVEVFKVSRGVGFKGFYGSDFRGKILQAANEAQVPVQRDEGADTY